MGLNGWFVGWLGSKLSDCMYVCMFLLSFVVLCYRVIFAIDTWLLGCLLRLIWLVGLVGSFVRC